MFKKNIEINGQSFSFTKLENSGFTVGLRSPKTIGWNGDHPIAKSVHTAFDYNNFKIARAPIVVGNIDDEEKFSRINGSLFISANDIRVLDCPIKFPGSNEYKIPNELRQFDEAIAKIVSIEHSINPYITQYYAYITVDQGYVEANEFQRRPGCHVDGFQGARVKTKRSINRSYVIYDRVPTVFYNQPFETSHLNPVTDNFFLSFDEQAKESASLVHDPYSILLMDAYTVHKASRVDYPVYRTFFRLSYDVNVFDRLGNTHNPLFDYNWKMVSRDSQKRLTHKSLEKYHAA